MFARKTIRLSTLIKAKGEEKVAAFLAQTFSCSRNKDVESFLHHKAILFEGNHASRTYLILSQNGELLAYFSLSFKEIQVKVSNTFLKKNFGRFHKGDRLKVFLIGQIGKNDKLENNPIKLCDVLEEIYSQIKLAQDVIGGKIVILECEDNAKLIQLYEAHQFKLIDTVEDETQLKTMFIVPELVKHV